MNYVPTSTMVFLSVLEKDLYFAKFMWKKVKNPLQVRIADNSIMTFNEAIKGLSIKIGGVQCIILVLWAID